MTFPRQIPTASLSWLAGLWMLAIDNTVFWRTLWAGRDDSSLRSVFALAGLALVLWALLSLMVRLLCWPRLAKPAVVVLLLVAAAAAHFIGSYGILIDKGMIRNVLQTDWREAGDLASVPLLIDLALRGLLPAALVVVLRIEFVSWRAAAMGVARHAALTIGLALAFAAAFYGDYASAARNQRELRHVLTPTNVLNGFYGLWKERSRADRKLTRVGEDARRAPPQARPLRVVLVVGETARAANFSLGGYGRPTNQALVGKDVVYFSDVTACGTDTATSLPCMFSDLGAERFSVAAAGARENVLDVLARAGVSVRWLDNNSGCKGVCQRVPSVDLSRNTDPGLCDGRECLDGVLVRGLREGLAGSAGAGALVDEDGLTVLHMKGSHGPAYHRRYPPSSRRFEPTCDTNEIQRCSQDALRNTYDNSIVYTSEILAQIIDVLAAQADRVDSVLLYASDHGESLGEKGVYLHGLPRIVAPAEQTSIPMIAWLSAGAQQRLGVSRAALQQTASKSYSHDNLAPTLLGSFGVQTRAYRAELDLLVQARAVREPGLGDRASR